LLLLVTEGGKERNWTVTLLYSIKCVIERKGKKKKRKNTWMRKGEWRL